MSSPNFQHTSVLLHEVLQYLNVNSGDFAADLTAGGGGHLQHIAQAVGPSGRVIALDRDERALQEDAAGGVAKKYSDRIQLIHASFGQVGEILQNLPVIPVKTGTQKNVILGQARIIANANSFSDSEPSFRLGHVSNQNDNSLEPNLRQDDTTTSLNRRFRGNDKDLDCHAALAMTLDTANSLDTPEHGNGKSIKLNALLCDLGVSSPQLDIAERGFSFKSDGPLDMRMDRSCGRSAYDLLKDLKEDQLADVLYQFGEERLSRRIARTIKSQWPISNSTLALAELIAKCYPKKYHRIHPATRSFQALRIAVNHELDEIHQLLTSLPHIMHTGGRVVFISFHSLEDRIIKHYFREHKEHWKILTKKPVCASPQEIEQNPRSRSAKLRAYEYLGNLAIDIKN